MTVSQVGACADLQRPLERSEHLSPLLEPDQFHPRRSSLFREGEGHPNDAANHGKTPTHGEHNLAALNGVLDWDIFHKFPTFYFTTNDAASLDLKCLPAKNLVIPEQFHFVIPRRQCAFAI